MRSKPEDHAVNMVESNASSGWGRSTSRVSLFHERSWLLLLSLISVFAVAFGLRVATLEAPGIIAEREYRSAPASR